MPTTTHLDQVLSFGFGDERLELRRSESVDETRLRDDEQKDLGTGENRQFVGLSRLNVSVHQMMLRKRAKTLFIARQVLEIASSPPSRILGKTSSVAERRN